MNDCPDKKRHRRNALARARRCSTCKKGPLGWGDHRDGIGACIGCGELIGYYSCSPGYCVACAHDPCWVRLSDLDAPRRPSKADRLKAEAINGGFASWEDFES